MKAPIDVIGLNGIGNALRVEHSLIEFHPIGKDIIGGGIIRIVRCAEVNAARNPAVYLDSALLPRLAIRAGVESLRERGRVGIRYTDLGRSAVGPVGKREGRGGQGRRQSPAGRCGPAVGITLFPVVDIGLEILSTVTEKQIRDAFFRNRDAAAALAGHTARVDEIVAERWKWMPHEVALGAVGGYGRRELFPYSDVDLLILTPNEKTQGAIKNPLSMFLRDLWDQGLRISQSVHTPAECNQIDASNAELAVSLLDRRFLAGDEALFAQIRDPRADLGRNIVALTNDRHAKFQGTIYHLEPNVKDSPGGLRDLQVLRWLGKLGAGDSELPAGVPVLFEIRCFLHYLAGRDDNKLSFERQDEIAALIGALSPEALMRQYYRAVRDISRLANRRLDRFESKSSRLFSNFRDRTQRLSNSDFSVLHGSVFFRSTLNVESDPGHPPAAFRVHRTARPAACPRHRRTSGAADARI